MAHTNVTIRMDENLKNQADDALGKLGMSFTTAVNIFTKQVIQDQAIPFPITTQKSINNVTLDAATSFAEHYESDFKRMAK